MGRMGYLARGLPHQKRELAEQDPYPHFMVSLSLNFTPDSKADCFLG